MAPLRPLTELREGKEKPEHKIQKCLQERFSHFHRKDRGIFSEMYAAMQLMALYMEGEQNPKRNPATGLWGVVPTRRDQERSVNMLQFYSNMLTSKGMASDPDIIVKPGRNKDNAISAAKAGKAVVDFYERQFYTADFVWREQLLGQQGGTYINRFRFDDSVESASLLVDVFESKQVPSAGFGLCSSCGFSSEKVNVFKPDPQMPSVGSCPECGQAAMVQQNDPQTLHSVVGQQKHSQGDLVCDQMPLYGLRFDLAKKPEDSSYLINRQRIPFGFIRKVLGNVMLPNSDKVESDLGLDIMEALAKAGTAVFGTALKTDTPIPTPLGWAEIGNLEIGDEVFSDDGSVCKITGTSGIMFERPCYEVEFDDGSVIIADGDHLWRTYMPHEREKRGKNQSGSIRTTEQIKRTLTASGRVSHLIKSPSPLQLPAQALPIDPYQLGLWLGDGNSKDACFATVDVELLEAFAADFDVRKRKAPYLYSICGGFHSQLKRLGVLGKTGSKFIPPAYLRGSIDQRLALLQGLMDTDGSASLLGYCTFSNSNPRIKDAVLELLASLGIKAGISYTPSYIHKSLGSETSGQWRIHFSSELPVFRLRRKLERQKREFRKARHGWRRIIDVRPTPSVPVCCISIDAPSHLYLAGPTMIPTHNSGNSYTYRAGSEYQDVVTFDEMWLLPECYADVIISGDEQTLGGQTLPKGKLIDVFPDGLVAVGLNGMAVLLGLHAEKAKDHIVSGCWFKKSMSGAGRGLQDSIEVQKRANILDSQRLVYLASTATPAVMYLKTIIDADKVKYLADPHTNIGVDPTKLPDGFKLPDAFHQFSPQYAGAAQLVEYIETFCTNAFAFTTGVTEFSSGLPGAAGQNDTATGAQLEQSTADMVNMPVFDVKAEVRRRSAEITVELFRKHMPVKRTIQLTGKFGRQQSIDLSGADLDTDLVFEVAKNSQIPKGPYAKRQDMNACLQLFGGFMGYAQAKQIDPRGTAEVVQAWDLDLESDEMDDIEELCRKRLEQMKQGVTMGLTDPVELIAQIQPPISEVELNLDNKAKWFARWLDEDDGQESPMSLRKAAELVATGQGIGAVQQNALLAQGEGAVQAAGQQPQAEAEQAANAQSAQIEGAGQEGQMAADAQMAQMDGQESEASRKHEAEQNAFQQAHEARMQQGEMKLKQQEMAHKERLGKIAASKAKVKSKAKAA